MSLFLAIFKEPLSPDLVELAESGPTDSVFEVSDHVLAISSYVENPQVLSEHLGMVGGAADKRVGVVFKLNGSYKGYYRKTLWEWLSEHRS
jgi:hypothetical protein